MNTFEVVMLKSDSNAVPVKYAVVECSIAATLATSYVWLKCVAYGVDTLDNLKLYSENLDSSILQGKPGDYSIATLDSIVPYSRRTDIQIPFTPVNIG